MNRCTGACIYDHVVSSKKMKPLRAVVATPPFSIHDFFPAAVQIKALLISSNTNRFGMMDLGKIQLYGARRESHQRRWVSQPLRIH